MSIQQSTRYLVAAMCCFATLLSVDFVAAQTPPPLPPPNIGGRPPGIGDRSGQARGPRGSSASTGDEKKSSKPKFVDLLEAGDLSEFRGYKDEAIGDGWDLDGGTLYFDGSGAGGQDLITKKQYGDFELQFEYKLSEGGNSGVMYRVSTGDAAPYMSGPEFQVLDDENHDDGKNELTSSGSLYGLYAPENKREKKATGWNACKIIVKGNKIIHLLNARKVLEAEIGSDDWNERLADSKFKDWEKFAKNSSGHIAFQDHGNEVWFRKIRIKDLGGGSEDGDDESEDDDDDEDDGKDVGAGANSLQDLLGNRKKKKK